MHDRNLEIEPYKSWMLRNGALRCKGQKPRSHFDWLQADEFKRLDERPFCERQVMVEEIPVCATSIPDVGLEDEQASAWSQHPPHLSQRLQKIPLGRQMLEEVAGKNYVNALVSQSAKVRAGTLDHLHARISVSPHLLTEVQRDSPTADDVIDKFAFAPR